MIDPTESIRFYQAALAIRPLSATAHNNLAVALVSLGRSTEAITQYEQARAFDPNSAIIAYNLGLELASTRPREAILHLQKSIELNPKLAVAYLTLGEVYLHEMQSADALKTLQSGLQLLDDNDSNRPQVLKLIQSSKRQIEKPQIP